MTATALVLLDSAYEVPATPDADESTSSCHPELELSGKPRLGSGNRQAGTVGSLRKTQA